ncbi:MAG: hypothetical protein K8I04_03760 [Gammaproteobacteria bacterium]|nr:hypothetical protein [Gammaproteobacteria bacterium]
MSFHDEHEDDQVRVFVREARINELARRSKIDADVFISLAGMMDADSQRVPTESLGVVGDDIGVSMAQVNRSVKRLVKDGMVLERREGRETVYYINPTVARLIPPPWPPAFGPVATPAAREARRGRRAKPRHAGA